MKRWFAATLAAAIFLLAACSEQPGFSVSGVSPVTGGAGTELSIAGTGFTGATSVTVCGVSLEAIDLTVEERKVAAPGTIGALTGSATLSGVVPDLGPSAECSVELTRPDGATVTWQGTFSFIGVPAVPENQPPTTSGLADLSDNELTLEFTSRVGTAAHVVVTATDPSGASVEAGFAVAFEVGIVRFEAPGLSQTELDDLTIMVTHVGDHVASAPAVELLLLRAGEYRFAGTLVEEAGTYIDRTKRDSVSARVDPSTETLVTLHLTEVPGSGRMWMPGRLVSLLSFTDDVLASGGT